MLALCLRTISPPNKSHFFSRVYGAPNTSLPSSSLLFLWPMSIHLCCPLPVPNMHLDASVQYRDLTLADPSDWNTHLCMPHIPLASLYILFKSLLRFYHLKEAYHDHFYFNTIIQLSVSIPYCPILSIPIILPYFSIFPYHCLSYHLINQLINLIVTLFLVIDNIVLELPKCNNSKF